MMLRIHQIGNDRMETLSTGDFLEINAPYHGKSVPENQKPCHEKLTGLGLVELVDRSKYSFVRNLYAAAGRAGVHTRVIGWGGKSWPGQYHSGLWPRKQPQIGVKYTETLVTKSVGMQIN